MIERLVLTFLILSIYSCNNPEQPQPKKTTGDLSPNDSFLLAKHRPPEPAYLAYEPSVRPDRVVLTFSDTVSNGMVITWRTDTTQHNMEIQYAPDRAGTSFEDSKISVLASHEDVQGINYVSRYHSAYLRQLQAGKAYLYRIGKDKLWSEWSRFTVPKITNEPFRFIYMGDAQNHLFDTWPRVMRAAYQNCHDAAFVLHAGDLVNHADNDYEWAEFFTGTEPFNKSIPIIAAPGNHEYVKNLKGEKIAFTKYWNPQFQFSSNGPIGFEDRAYYVDYSFARIIVLDSNRDIELQAEWLNEVLAANKKNWSIVCFHHPVYSGSKKRYNKSINEFVKPVLDKHNVDLVLQGHDHTYARGTNRSELNADGNEQEGSVYVISVSGEKQYDLEVQPWMDRHGSNLQLFQIIEVGEREIVYRAYTADEELYDEVEITKNKAGLNRVLSKF